MPLLLAVAIGVAIPPPFRGEWVIAQSDCQSRQGDNVAGLVVRRGSVVYYEGADEITRILSRSSRTVTYKANHSDEDGDDSVIIRTLRLSRDGTRLIAASTGRPKRDLFRCHR